MIKFSNLRMAWQVLTSRKIFLLATSDKNCTNEDLCRNAIISAAVKLHWYNALSKPRYDMIMSVLYDPSVIMLSKEDKGSCCASYDCASDDDFADLKQCKIE